MRSSRRKKTRHSSKKPLRGKSSRSRSGRNTSKSSKKANASKKRLKGVSGKGSKKRLGSTSKPKKTKTLTRKGWVKVVTWVKQPTAEVPVKPRKKTKREKAKEAKAKKLIAGGFVYKDPTEGHQALES